MKRTSALPYLLRDGDSRINDDDDVGSRPAGGTNQNSLQAKIHGMHTRVRCTLVAAGEGRTSGRRRRHSSEEARAGTRATEERYGGLQETSVTSRKLRGRKDEERLATW